MLCGRYRPAKRGLPGPYFAQLGCSECGEGERLKRTRINFGKLFDWPALSNPRIETANHEQNTCQDARFYAILCKASTSLNLKLPLSPSPIHPSTAPRTRSSACPHSFSRHGEAARIVRRLPVLYKPFRPGALETVRCITCEPAPQSACYPPCF